MKEVQSISQNTIDAVTSRARKPGRPRVIPDDMGSLVIELYRDGNGYRAIARVLARDYGLGVDYSSVRRTLRRLGGIG